MRDVEFSASRENIRSKWLMQRFLSTILQKGLCRTDRYDRIKEFARKAPTPNEMPNFCRSDPFP